MVAVEEKSPQREIKLNHEKMKPSAALGRKGG
jgi:hypothetical protein